jgi:hypothetical protein
MIKRTHTAGLVAALLLASFAAWSKIPPPPPAPPMDPAAKAAADAKKAAADQKAKEEQAAAEDRAVKNFQANMKREGKPIPKPVPVAAAAAPAKGAEKKPQANTKAAEKKGKS